jgi:periplasmic protein TonB
MSRDMFGDVVERSIRVGSKAWYTVPLSITVHTLIIGGVIIIPLMAADVLPTPPSMMTFVVPSPSPPPSPPPPPPQTTEVSKPAVQDSPTAAPLVPQSGIRPETGIEEVVRDAASRVERGGGVPGGFPGGLGEVPPPPPPPPPPPQAPVRVGGNIRSPMKTKDVKPTYPAIAQSARVQGVVIIEATIGPDGRVQEAKVLRSIPLLDAAALDAVKQWTFTPTLLNGVPVPVIITVTVNFALQ